MFSLIDIFYATKEVESEKRADTFSFLWHGHAISYLIHDIETRTKMSLANIIHQSSKTITP